MKKEILKKIQDRTLVAGVVGLGYVGLPLAVEKAKAGFRTIGFDVQKQKVDAVNAGQNYIGDVVDSDLQQLVAEGRLTATSDFSFIKDVDFVAICVPTPLDTHQQPDISYVRSSAESIAKYLHKGMMVVLESTTYPGTTEELIKPILETSGLKCEQDFYLGFSPERVDPGNLIYKTKNTPKVVGAIGEDAKECICAVYESVLQNEVFRASSPAVAEMTKILENTYRNINIGLINELAILCNKMGIDLWEVIDAASTKPFGFKAFYPGPGLGGHCIPLDPYYLSWKAREYGFHTSMIEASMMVNDRMPEYCMQRAGLIMGRRFSRSLNGAKILQIGISYKQDIDDCRESPAIRVYEWLTSEGSEVTCYDPYVKQFKCGDGPIANERKSCREGSCSRTARIVTVEQELTAEMIEAADLVIITAAHTKVDYELIQKHAKFIFDTKNAMKDIKNRDNIEVL